MKGNCCKKMNIATNVIRRVQKCISLGRKDLGRFHGGVRDLGLSGWKKPLKV